jgi:hypothetical protein
MKKVIVIITILLLAVAGLTGCAGSPLVDAGFTEAADGGYTLLDTENSPLPEGGVKIDLTTGPQGYVKFTVTDEKGTEMADYYQFSPAESTMLRHRYVAAMGMTYNYYFDYAAMELAKVTDAEDKDVTQGLKMAGRWDGAVAETKEHAASLLDYFKAEFGMTINEAVSQ